MLYIVRYNPGNGGWAVANLINTALGHSLEPSKSPQFEGNAHNTNLYDELSIVKELMRTQTDTNLDNVCLPIHYEFNIPSSATYVIDVFRSANQYYVPWNLYNKEEDGELTQEFIDRHTVISTDRDTGDFDTALVFDRYNPEYVGEFLSKYNLKPNNETWRFYNDYVAKQIEMNNKCTITQT